MTRLTQEELYDADLLLDLFEERAAIIQYDGGFPRDVAEMLAAQVYGFESKYKLLNWVKDLKEVQ